MILNFSVGMGGLGHFAVLWAVALGAEVTVLSHSPGKKEDAFAMGAKNFVVTSEEKWFEPYAYYFDFILNCADATHKFNLKDYFGTMKVMGRFHNVGLGDQPLPELMAQDFAGNGCYIGASHIGNRPEMLAMFDLASKQEIKSWITKVPISEAGCSKAVKAVNDNDGVRYRFVLNEYDAAFGKRD
jgi:alcohol dehydrogenase (NADP+)